MKNKYVLLLIISFCVVLTSFISKAQPKNDEKSLLPQMLSISNVGLEYYFSIPPCFEDESQGHHNFIKIFVTSSEQTDVEVKIDGSGYLATKKTIPNDIIEFNINPAQAQPYSKAGRDPILNERVFPGRGIQIKADQPITVYVMIRFRYTSDGFLALPVSSLGVEYIVAGWNVDPMFRAIWNYKLPNITTITAAYNNTRVRFTLGGNYDTKTPGGMKPGDSKEFILNKGDVWSVAADTDNGDLTGSKIIADKPVAVVTGNMCANIPKGNQWCDYIVEMDLPVSSWGNDLLVPKIPGRKYSSLIRIFAKEQNTQIYRNGLLLGTLPKSYGIEGEAFLSMRMLPMETPTPRSVVISGDKPINVVLYNTGVQEDNYIQSDPFMMAMTPLQQFTKEITFCTPGILGGQGFALNNMNIVYETDGNGKMPDHMEYTKVQSGNLQWQKLSLAFPGEDEVFQYNVDGKEYAVKNLTLPGDGVYKIRSNTLFAAYSFGYDNYDSYGYPTNLILSDIQEPRDTVPPSLVYENRSGIIDGSVTDMPEDPAVRRNLALILLDQTKSINVELNYTPIISGVSRTSYWSLTPIDVTEEANATVLFVDRAGNVKEYVVSIAPPKAALSTYAIDFGSMILNSEAKEEIVKIINYSATETIELDMFNLADGNQNISFDLSSLPSDKKIAPKDFAEFAVRFIPVELGDFSDIVRITTVDNLQLDLTVKAKVTETSDLPVILASDINFGTIYVGETHSRTVKIDNQGTGDLKLLGYKFDKKDDFHIGLPITNNEDLFANPIIIMPNETYNFEISFTPQEEGTFNETLNYLTNSTSLKDYTVITGKAELVNSVEDNENKYAEIYPNPANKLLNISLQDGSKLPKLIDIVNTKGDVVYSVKEITQSRVTLNTENLSIGSYYLRFLTGDGSSRVVKKFSITR